MGYLLKARLNKEQLSYVRALQELTGHKTDSHTILEALNFYGKAVSDAWEKQQRKLKEEAKESPKLEP